MHPSPAFKSVADELFAYLERKCAKVQAKFTENYAKIVGLRG